MNTRVEIDPNVRVRGQLTYAGLEDVRGPLAVGQTVEVYESESDLVGEGRVVEIDLATRLVYLGVDWGALRVRGGEEPQHRSIGRTWFLYGQDMFDAVQRPALSADVSMTCAIAQASNAGTTVTTIRPGVAASTDEDRALVVTSR